MVQWYRARGRPAQGRTPAPAHVRARAAAADGSARARARTHQLRGRRRERAPQRRALVRRGRAAPQGPVVRVLHAQQQGAVRGQRLHKPLKRAAVHVERERVRAGPAGRRRARGRVRAVRGAQRRGGREAPRELGLEPGWARARARAPRAVACRAGWRWACGLAHPGAARAVPSRGAAAACAARRTAALLRPAPATRTRTRKARTWRPAPAAARLGRRLHRLWAC